jgi:hypothetical protein
MYGFCLGMGLGTRIQVSAFYVVIALSIVLANPLTGAVVLSAFGLGRALPLILCVLRYTPLTLASLVSWNTPLLGYLNGCSLAFAGAVLVWNVFRSLVGRLV